MSPLQLTGSGAFDDAAAEAATAPAALALPVLRNSVRRRACAGELDSGGRFSVGSDGMSIGCMLSGSMKLPLAWTGASESLVKLSDLTLVRGPMSIISADCGALIRV